MRAGRILVNSIPKAGTFFMVEVLKELGYEAVPVHLEATGSFFDYALHEEINGHRLKDCVITGHVPLHLIPGDWQVIFMYRDLKECCISLARWCKSTQAWGDIPEIQGAELVEYVLTKYLHRYVKMVERVWDCMGSSMCCKIDYNNVNSVALGRVLNIDPDTIDDAVISAQQQHTRTSTGYPSLVSEWWSPQCDKLFNDKLGAYYDAMA